MNFVEQCLYDYKTNVASISVMKEELSSLKSVHCQKYDAHAVNGVSDPVFDVTVRTIALERRITKTEKRTKPVEKLRADLFGSDYRYQHMREILDLKYINHECNREVLRKMAVSERTFRRRKRELLELAGRYFREAKGE